MSAEAGAPPRASSQRPSRVASAVVLGAASFALIVVGVASIGVGSTAVDPIGGVLALLSPEESALQALVRDTRLPRMLLAALVGAALAVAGLLAQSMTRNPLASQQTFGINAGASFAIVVTAVAVPGTTAPGAQIGHVGAGMIGAAAIGLVMWAVSTTGAVTVVSLALAGMTIQIVLSTLVQAVLIVENATQDLVFWLAGSVAGAQWSDVATLAPAVAIGLAVAIGGAPSFALLALDATTAAGLGQDPRRAAGVAAVVVVLLAGASVAVAGPIGFVGLMVPHIARRLVGAGFGRLLAACAVLGPLLLVTADLGGRLVAFPSETPAGIVTAVVGAPVFLVLAARRRFT